MAGCCRSILRLCPLGLGSSVCSAFLGLWGVGSGGTEDLEVQKQPGICFSQNAPVQKKNYCVSAVFNELSNPCKPCSSRSSLSLAPLLAPLASPLLRLQGPLKPRPCLATSPLWSGRQVVPCLTCVQPVGHPTPLSPSLPSSLLRLSPPACSQGISRFYRETSSKSRS